MRIAVQLNEDDLLALANERERFQRRTSTALQIYRRTVVVLHAMFFAGLALGVGGTLALLPRAGPIVQTMVIVAVAALLWVVLFRVVQARLHADTLCAVTRESLNRHGQPRLDFDFDVSGFSVWTGYGTLQYTWADVRTVFEAANRLFFFLPLEGVFVVPLGNLEAEHRSALFALVQSNRHRFEENDPADIGTR